MKPHVWLLAGANLLLVAGLLFIVDRASLGAVAGYRGSLATVPFDRDAGVGGPSYTEVPVAGTAGPSAVAVLSAVTGLIGAVTLLVGAIRGLVVVCRKSRKPTKSVAKKKHPKKPGQPPTAPSAETETAGTDHEADADPAASGDQGESDV